MRYPSWTIQTSADGHIVIATSAKSETQMGVSGTAETTARAGLRIAALRRPVIGPRPARDGMRRATPFAREIGTTLLFMRSPAGRRRDRGHARSIDQTAAEFHWATDKYPPARQPSDTSVNTTTPVTARSCPRAQQSLPQQVRGQGRRKESPKDWEQQWPRE
jgi:hypothetical protein